MWWINYVEYEKGKRFGWVFISNCVNSCCWFKGMLDSLDLLDFW